MSFQHAMSRVRSCTGTTSLESLSNGSVVAHYGRGSGGVFIISGVHGDEDSGPEALLRLMEQGVFDGIRVTVCPILNDKGWDCGLRLWNGVDLNRCWGKSEAPSFVQETEKILVRERPSVFLDLHDDLDSPYPYLFRERHDSNQFFDPLARHLGATQLLWDTADWGGTTEEYARGAGVPLCCTFETPIHQWAELRRVIWAQRAVLWCLLNLTRSRD